VITLFHSKLCIGCITETLLKTEEVIAKKQSEDTNFVFVIWQCSGCALNVCRERGEVLDISGLVLCASML